MALKIKKGLTDTDYILRNKANSIIQTEKTVKKGLQAGIYSSI